MTQQSDFIPKVGDVVVFELDNDRIKQISIPLENVEDGNSFVETMKEGMYYTHHPEKKLVVAQIMNIV
jgi:hypothetical protein